MAISNEELMKLVHALPEEAKKSAYDYLTFLALRHTRPNWAAIDQMEPDDAPLTEEELRQLDSEEGFVTGKDAKREFGLSVDLP
ncbi:hypothetical protein BEP19_16760 [Ammoniphilus oxalaticus]|uniref:Uncharacterized protein n=1 Tax=Ammoniphilus oxalaticus TaxID=66863 RepID=A0A419SQ36_9BACL|nr:hypothetical protein [Ammoniphilus oxalaticus]RKD26489.1 hypothetical protein BEP19_16760 [Ammoniphilus oxalaticus]